MKKTKRTIDIWKKDCPECGRIIEGVNPAQLQWNFQVHHDSCKRKSNLIKSREDKKQ